MTIYRQPLLVALLVMAVSSLHVLAAEKPGDIPPPRMANGGVIEGAVQEATPAGLVIQGESGRYTAPWKYLSAGTRYRHELPMLAAQKAKAAKKAQTDADAKKKAAAAKAVAIKAAATKAAGVASNLPPVNK